MLLKRYEPRLVSTDALREFRLDYVRLARVYTDGVSADAGQRQVVETVVEIGRLLEIRILAEGVGAGPDLETLRAIGVHAASE